MGRGVLKTTDELAELKGVFRGAEIAEIAGLQPETISRIKPGKKLSRDTEDAIDGIYFVFHKLMVSLEGDEEAVRFAFLARRPELEGRCLSDLLKERNIEDAVRLVEESIDAARASIVRVSTPTMEETATTDDTITGATMSIDLDFTEPQREMTESAARMFAMSASYDEEAFLHEEERLDPAAPLAAFTVSGTVRYAPAREFAGVGAGRH